MFQQSSARLSQQIRARCEGQCVDDIIPELHCELYLWMCTGRGSNTDWHTGPADQCLPRAPGARGRTWAPGRGRLHPRLSLLTTGDHESVSKSSVSPQSENRESIGWECRKTTRRYQCPAGPFYTRFLAKLCLKFVIYIRNMYICMMSWYWMLNEINSCSFIYLLWYRIIFHTCRI